ncbi:MAG: AbrB/MazE/SpoVT family DNA-binding domain-containing protein [Nitrososphaerales archaeon]|jgi:AbrB family looped-hinge helix DNA binding protein
MTQEIVKVTSKGQVTLPARLRTKAGLKKGSYIYMQPIGEFVLMKRVDDLGIEQISGILQKVAKEKGLTKSLLTKEVEKARSELWKERYEKRKGTRAPRH